MKRTATARERDLLGVANTIRDRVLTEIGECAAYAPKRQRPAFASMLLGISEALGDKPVRTDPAVLALDVRIRKALAATVTSLTDAFPAAREYIAATLAISSDLAREGKIPMGTKRLPRAAAVQS